MTMHEHGIKHNSQALLNDTLFFQHTEIVFKGSSDSHNSSKEYIKDPAKQV